MTVVIQYANAYFNLKNQDLRSNAFVETKTSTLFQYHTVLYIAYRIRKISGDKLELSSAKL